MDNDQGSEPQHKLFSDSQSQKISVVQQQQGDEFDLDIFEEDRREQVLREINQQAENPRQQHDELNQILQKRQKREQKQDKRKAQDQLKRLRQKNALQFFRKMKTILLLNFKDSMLEAFEAKRYLDEQKFRIFSCLKLDTLTLYQQLASQLPKKIKRQIFIEFIESIFKVSKIEFDEVRKKYIMIWALAISLGIGFRTIKFVDISNLQLQSFYNLKYDQKKENKKKNKKKPTKRLSRKGSKQQLSSEELQNMELNELSQQILGNSLSLIERQTTKNQKEILCQKTFRQSYCEIYCPFEDNWVLYNMQILEKVQIDHLKKRILNKKAIIGFYSTRVIHFLPQFEFLTKQRVFGNIQLRDHTNNFCDKIENVLKRRNRLGCKQLYRDVIKESHLFKTLTIMNPFDKQLIEWNQKKQYQWALEHFPRNIPEMRLSQYFTVPSLVDKYMVLKEQAKPIPNLQFRQEKVYSRKDLTKVASRMGWVDQYRMVKFGELPVKTTETMRKSTTKLYLFTQTEPFVFKFNEEGDFEMDQEYNSIYIPPTFTPPKGYILLPFNVDYICKKYKFRSARIVQGFDVAGWHIIPNNIGFLVEQKNKQEIEKYYWERQEKLKEKKQSKRQKDAIGLWKKLFKSIIITQNV